jgi:hypothetical protein
MAAATAMMVRNGHMAGESEIEETSNIQHSTPNIQ